MHLLLNWLVQGTALTLVVALCVRGRRTMTAATRERVWWATAIGLTLMPAAYPLADHFAVPRAALLVAAPRPDQEVIAGMAWDVVATGTLAVWAAWTIASLAGIGLDIVRVRRARASSAAFPRDREARLPMWMAMRNGARGASLVVSTSVYCASVLGLGRPLIAVAPDTMDALTDEELDQVVVHEHAHVQRRDDLAILAQRLISAVAGLHPGVWWLTRALAIDREIACDDWVVTRSGMRVPYARCLVKLASAGALSRRSLAPSALLSRSHLSVRVAALLDVGRTVAIIPSRGALVAFPAVFLLIVSCAAMPLVGVARVRLLPLLEPAPPMLIAARVDAVEAAVPRKARVTARPKTRPQQAPFAPIEGGSSVAAVSPYSPVLKAADDPLPAASVAPLPATSLPQLGVGMVPTRAPDAAPISQSPGTPWQAAADAGRSIGSRSQSAALKAAAVFSQFGKSFANPF